MESYRKYLDLSSAHIQRAVGETPVSYTDKLFATFPLVAKINKKWREQWQEPFQGITNNGAVIPNLYEPQDDGVPIGDIVNSAKDVLKTLSDAQRQAVIRPLNAPERRAWSNPEMYVHRFGIRLDEVDNSTAETVMQLMRATLSEEGFEKALSTTEINHFLGELVHTPKILNRYSYNFLIFTDSEPSTSSPWGWMLYGHHLCLNVFLHQNQIILTPTFTGAEPNLIDAGPLKGTQILTPEEKLGLDFMQRLSPDLQKKAQIFDHMLELPDWRWNPADQRHLCGAYQDNRVVPYEGVLVAELDASFIELLLELVGQFHLYLPKRARENRLAQVQKHLDETYFSWIGGYGSNDPFYYRIQSPIIICEFDHHSGVFLSNKEPAKFHIHTIVRSPNGGDYGYALLKDS